MNQVSCLYDGYFLLDANQETNWFWIQTSLGAIQFHTDDTSAYGKLEIYKTINKTNWVKQYWINESNVIVDGYYVNGATTDLIIELKTLCESWVKIKYIYTGGTGGINYWVRFK